MGRPALTLLALLGAGCAARPPVARAPSAVNDLAPPAAVADGGPVRLVGDHREAVDALLDAYRAALAARDPARLRALFAPTLGGTSALGPTMSREAWIALGDPLFTAAGMASERLARGAVVRSYATFPPPRPAALAPGEWLVQWPGVGTQIALPGGRRDQALPSELRVAMVDGEARFVGIDDLIVVQRGPIRAAFSGSRQP